MSAQPTTAASLVPEALCRHRDLEHSTLARATCRDCGGFVDLAGWPVISASKLEEAIEKASDAAYDSGYTEGLTEGEDQVAERWRRLARDVVKLLDEVASYLAEDDDAAIDLLAGARDRLTGA